MRGDDEQGHPVPRVDHSMTYRFVSRNCQKGDYHPILEVWTRASLVIEHAYSTLDCSECDAVLPSLTQFILKTHDGQGVFAVLCEFCAQKHIDAAYDRAVAFMNAKSE